MNPIARFFRGFMHGYDTQRSNRLRRETQIDRGGNRKPARRPRRWPRPYPTVVSTLIAEQLKFMHRKDSSFITSKSTKFPTWSAPRANDGSSLKAQTV